MVVDFDNSELVLRPGMTATLTIITAARDDVLKVPRRALRFRPRETAATVLKGNLQRLWIEGEEGDPRPVEVRLGLGDDEFVEVAGQGLAEGDPVIVGYVRER